MATKITLFILDDNIYKSQEFVEQSIYDSKIDSKLLLQLADSYEWKGQHNLQQLTSEILKSEHSRSGDLITFGFTHPSICLDEIDKGLSPDVVIFDWEYGSESNKESSNWLTEILNSTDAFIFVYSMVRDEIPPFLNKHEFDKYANRFQLLLKGNDRSSIFTSEEFIVQYILSRVSNNNQIKLHGLTIDFHENGYLKNPSDILHLENIFGTTFLIQQLKNQNLSISNETIEKIVENANGKLLFDEKGNFLITPDSTLLIDKFKPEGEISYLETLKKYGLKALQEVLETGLTKV
jgi:hypothetical protein